MRIVIDEKYTINNIHRKRKFREYVQTIIRVVKSTKFSMYN